MADDKADPLDAALLREEQERAIRMAAERLSPRCQRLLGLLMGDDDLPYKEIAEQLSMPIGSIGPTRGRCLEHLRQILAEMQAPRSVGYVDFPARHRLAESRQSRRPPVQPRSVSASTHLPPESSTSGKALRTSVSRSGTNRSTRCGGVAVEPCRADDGNIRPRHTETMLGC